MGQAAIGENKFRTSQKPRSSSVSRMLVFRDRLASQKVAQTHAKLAFSPFRNQTTARYPLILHSHLVPGL